MCRICGFLIVCLIVVARASASDRATSTSIRESLTRGASYIAERGVWWIEKKECVSCHRTGTMVWSLAALRSTGLPVDQRLDTWRKWSVEASLKTNEKGKTVGLGNKEGVAQLLLSSRLFPAEDNAFASVAALTALVAADQQPDGSWKPGGQLPSQKRSLAETTAVTTMWQTLALLTDPEQKHRPAVDKALDYIRGCQPGKSTEWYAARLLIGQQLEDPDTVSGMRKRLLEQQNQDGGWGWLVDDPSDALGTGMAIYALCRANSKLTDDSVQNAVQFLLRTQQPAGSWVVNGTKEKKKGSPQETATYWGTTWAALALAELLGK